LTFTFVQMMHVAFLPAARDTTMFLVNDTPDLRVRQLRSWRAKHPSVALLVSAAYFEWTVCRAVIALSRRPNAEVRESLVSVYGLDGYKDLWKKELAHLPGAKRLPEVVGDWHGVTDAFKARNRLVHGRTRYTRNMGTPALETLISAVSGIMAYCHSHGIDINRRLPVRKKSTKTGTS
jgi:hypothetical protein